MTPFYTVRPLTGWNGAHTPAANRRSRWTFKASWADTTMLLERELTHLDAAAVVLQLDVAEQDLRIDGMLRANARPNHPGVRLLFDSKHGPLTYQADNCELWQHNVRSIALGLGALRAVDRYGITQHGQQYKGYRELEAGSRDQTTVDEACQILSAWSGVKVTPGESTVSLRARWREARAASHPDRHQGNADGWHAVENAARTLGLTRTNGQAAR